MKKEEVHVYIWSFDKHNQGVLTFDKQNQKGVGGGY